VLPIVLIAGRTSNAVFRTSEGLFAAALFTINITSISAYALMFFFMWSDTEVFSAWLSEAEPYLIISLILIAVDLVSLYIRLTPNL